MDRKQFDQLLALHCAPTLAGLKAASMVALPGRSLAELQGFFDLYEKCFECKGLKVLELRRQRAHVLLLIYRPVVLQRLLRRIKAQALLAECGYPPRGSLDELLRHLQERMQTSGAGGRRTITEDCAGADAGSGGRGTGAGERFPHEIGLFLGYPPHDVEGFIRYGGQNFRQCGFWKVYDNEKAVLHLFHCYAACIRRIYDSLQEGASLQSMICSAA